MSRLDDLTDEQRDEIRKVLKETLEWAHARLAAGRSSMPIRVDDAMLLTGMAAAALHESDRRRARAGVITSSGSEGGERG